MTDETETITYKGQLTLEFNQATREFGYALVHYTYPKHHEPQRVTIDEGDHIIIRTPTDGSVLIDRIVEFDYDSFKSMSLESGTFHQLVQNQPVNGILTNVDPSYWLNLFLNGYYADLTKKVK